MNYVIGLNRFILKTPKQRKEGEMDTWTFGLSLLVVGMGGTLLTLTLMSLLMGVLKKIFPVKEGEE